MLNVVVLGAGPHCTTQHAPALVHFVERYPGKIRLCAICDTNADRVERARETFGFEQSFTSFEAMLDEVEVQAAFAILPHTGMLPVLEVFMARGIPLVMEKPLGADLVESQSIVDAVERHDAPVMVSLNRRFDPAILKAKAWLAQAGPIRYLRGSMLRRKRTEPIFMWGTGIHLLDAMTAVAGPLTLARESDVHRSGAYGCVASLAGPDGLVASAEILPSSGHNEEALRMVGDDYCVDVCTGVMHHWSVRIQHAGERVLEEVCPDDEALDLRNGTYNETEAFLLALLEGRPLPAPSVHDAMVSSRVAGAVQDVVR